MADNVEKVSRLLDKMEEQVVLVGHSLGGITISAVAEARRRKLKALVYLCALLPTSGKASKDMTSLEPDTMFRLSRQVSPDGLTYTFSRDKAAGAVLRRRLAGGPLQGDGAPAARSRSRSRPRR